MRRTRLHGQAVQRQLLRQHDDRAGRACHGTVCGRNDSLSSRPAFDRIEIFLCFRLLYPDDALRLVLPLDLFVDRVGIVVLFNEQLAVSALWQDEPVFAQCKLCDLILRVRDHIIITRGR